MRCFNCDKIIKEFGVIIHNGNAYCKDCSDEYFVESKKRALKGQKTGIATDSSVIHQNDDTNGLNGMSEKLSGTDDRDLFGE